MAITEAGAYYYGAGQAWLGPRSTSTGLPTSFDVSLPEIDSLEVSLATEAIMHTSKRTSIQFEDLHIPYKFTGTVKMVCAQHSADLLAVYLYGTKTTIAGGAFSAVAFPTIVLNTNPIQPIGGQRTNVTALVISDSAGSPATLVLGTDYEADADAGVVKFLSLGAYTQPFKAAGTETAGQGVGIFQNRVVEKYLRFKGIDVAASDAIKTIDLYKVQIAPAATWTLLNDGSDVNKYEITGNLLKDTLLASSATFGQFGRYRE
jgi:hypothetical protein